MTIQKLRIVFMGTPEFAVPSLQQLVEAGFQVVGVVTAPDKPQGRGKKLGTSPVKDYAQSVGLPVLQPANLKSPQFHEALRQLQPDVQIIVAFRMLPEAVWSFPPLGSFNLHASLLPRYRGAAPINWAIMNGEKETGVTTFQLKHEIDTGNILLQETEPILETDTVGTLYERLMHKGAALLVKTVEMLQSGQYQLKPQLQLPDAPHAPKIFRETCQINWNQPAEKVRNFIRGLSPYPAAWTLLNGLTFKIFQSEHVPTRYKALAGTLFTDNKTFLEVTTGNGTLRLTEVQLEGKRRMDIQEFLRGNTLPSGQSFTTPPAV